MHGELHFARDFAALKIALSGVTSAPQPELIKPNILKFGAKYEIPVTYY